MDVVVRGGGHRDPRSTNGAESAFRGFVVIATAHLVSAAAGIATAAGSGAGAGCWSSLSTKPPSLNGIRIFGPDLKAGNNICW